MNMLNKRRRLNEETRQRRIDEAFSKAPRLREIQAEIRKNQAFVMNGKPGSKAGISAEKEILKLRAERDDLLKKHRIPKDFQAPVYTCEKCRDTGIVYMENEYCSCRNELILQIAARNSGFADMDLPSFEQFDLSLYDDEIATLGKTRRQFAAAILKYCKTFKGGNILLCGGVGLGKTFTAECVANNFMKMGKAVCYLSSTRMFLMLDEYKFGQDTSQTNRQKIALIYDSDLLIIDDLGAEFRSSFTESMLFDIINTRLMERKNTIISTNLDMDEIRELYSPRISSRIAGNYKCLTFYGDDIRTKKFHKK
jgi:DNA replication protein DnaC